MLQEEALSLTEEHFEGLDKTETQKLVKEATDAILPIIIKFLGKLLYKWFVPAKVKAALETLILLSKKG